MNDKAREIFNELCKYVGTTYDALEPTLRIREDGVTEWPYDEYTWSSAAEACFREWLMEKLKQRSYMNALTGSCFSVAKKRREAVVVWFVLMYGWKSSDYRIGKNPNKEHKDPNWETER